MAAGKLPLYIEKGATFRYTLTWQNGEPPAPVDLASYTARMQIRAPGSASGVNGGAVLIELTTENSRIALQGGGELGRIDLHLTATDTETLAGIRGVYDLELVQGVDVTRLLEGEVTLSPEVTRT
jgi:hypothetical protein